MNIKEYILENYTLEVIKDIAEMGCSTGACNDLIYYSDTEKFHDEHEQEIWDLLYEDSESQGCTIMELIVSFNGQKNVGTMQQFKNLLSWYAAETICNQIINENEEN